MRFIKDHAAIALGWELRLGAIRYEPSAISYSVWPLGEGKRGHKLYTRRTKSEDSSEEIE